MKEEWVCNSKFFSFGGMTTWHVPGSVPVQYNEWLRLFEMQIDKFP
jgi:hypothetical protein